jgi:hypothetical protein
MDLDIGYHVISDDELEPDDECDEQMSIVEFLRRVQRNEARIDLARDGNNTFKLRSVKAIGIGKGVSNWLDYYDRQLSVDEYREVYERAGGDRRDREHEH